MSDLIKYGYAPGNHMNKCVECESEFTGIKCAPRCPECAAKAFIKAELDTKIEAACKAQQSQYLKSIDMISVCYGHGMKSPMEILREVKAILSASPDKGEN